MQELIGEMKHRIKTLEKHIEHNLGERDEALGQVAGYDREIEREKKLVAQYRAALDQLQVTLTYVGTAAR